MSKEQPLITVVTVVYNDVQHIEDTILSVVNQTYPNIQYIIIDGGSTDGTVDIIKKYEERIAYWVSEPDKGIYDAMNKGIQKATGEWIGVMNSGDTFHSKTVLQQIFSFDEYMLYDVVYGDAIEVSSGMETVIKGEDSSYKPGVPPVYRHGASFVRGHIHKIYNFDLSKEELYGYALDYYCIYTLYRAGLQFKHVNVVVLDYDKEGISNHPWRNKYFRALIENEGSRNIQFYIRLLHSIFRSLMNRIRNY